MVDQQYGFFEIQREELARARSSNELWNWNEKREDVHPGGTVRNRQIVIRQVSDLWKRQDTFERIAIEYVKAALQSETAGSAGDSALGPEALGEYVHDMTQQQNTLSGSDIQTIHRELMPITVERRLGSALFAVVASGEKSPIWEEVARRAASITNRWVRIHAAIFTAYREGNTSSMPPVFDDLAKVVEQEHALHDLLPAASGT